MSFKYNKELLFKEFEDAKQKDIELSKKETLEEKENDIHINRIQFLKDHIDLKKKNPQYYSEVDIKFDNLLNAYESENPRDYFYMKIFGVTYAQKMRQEELENDVWESEKPKVREDVLLNEVNA